MQQPTLSPQLQLAMETARTNPHSPDAWVNLGKVLLAQTPPAPDRARECFTRALQIAPGHQAAQQELTALTMRPAPTMPPPTPAPPQTTTPPSEISVGVTSSESSSGATPEQMMPVAPITPPRSPQRPSIPVARELPRISGRAATAGLFTFIALVLFHWIVGVVPLRGDLSQMIGQISPVIAVVTFLGSLPFALALGHFLVICLRAFIHIGPLVLVFLFIGGIVFYLWGGALSLAGMFILGLGWPRLAGSVAILIQGVALYVIGPRKLIDFGLASGMSIAQAIQEAISNALTGK